MQVNFKTFLYIPLILLFLPAFAIWIPFLGGAYLIFYFVLYIFIIFLLIKDNFVFLLIIRKIFWNTHLRYFTITLGLIFLNSLLLSCIGITTLTELFRSYTVRIILGVLPVIIYFSYILVKYINYKQFVKLFMVLFWINLILGFISYLGMFFNIELITNFFDFFSNARVLAFAKRGIINQASDYVAFGLPRLDNFSEEPSGYAQFLFIFLPFVYTFSLTKLKLYKNVFFDNLFKKTLIPFTWVSIILTLSPIYLVLSFLFTFIYFYKSILRLCKRYFIVIAALIISFIIVFVKIDLSETYLSRIINVITQIHSFEDFIIVEPSLATRIVNYFNLFCIFLKHPLTGIGFGNASSTLLIQLQNSPLPLTPEIVQHLQIAYLSKTRLEFNSSYFFTLCAENGIFVVSFIFYFYYKIYKTLSFLLKKINLCNFDTTLIISLKGSFISLLIISFYNLDFKAQSIYVLTALTIILISKLYPKYFNKQEGDNNATD